MRALFTYNPSEDSLLPCKDIGLAFKSGDILQVLQFVLTNIISFLFILFSYIYRL